MLFGQIDIDEDLLAAQEEGRLVVFAGAGVSMGPPSNLPDFPSLAKQIGQEPLPVETLDRYLGRLSAKGVEIYKACVKAIDLPNSCPTLLHTKLIELFKNAEDLRLVTTNFDLHFSTVAKRKYPSVSEFFAPALPLGDDFNGVVYLHGSIKNPKARKMVLTDSDFGAAYLSDGWAKDFLTKLFQEFNVLFVGYSYNDFLIQYLTRGLGSRMKRQFVITDEPEADRWQQLGITPLMYRNEDHTHLELTECIEKWAELTSMQPSAFSEKFQKCLSNPLMVGIGETQFIRRYYNREDTVHYFVRFATSSEWIRWMYEENLVGDVVKGNSHQLLSHWLGEKLVQEEVILGYVLLERYGILNHVVCKSAVLQVVRMTEIAGSISQELLSWIDLLLSQLAVVRDGTLYFLISVLTKHDHWKSILKAISLLTQPTARDIAQHMGRPELDLVGDLYDLQQSWSFALTGAKGDGRRMMELFELGLNRCIGFSELCRCSGRNNFNNAIVWYSLSDERLGYEPIQFLVTEVAKLAEQLSVMGFVSIQNVTIWLESVDIFLQRLALLCLKTIECDDSHRLHLLLEFERRSCFEGSIYPDLIPLLLRIYPNLTDEEKKSLWHTIGSVPVPDRDYLVKAVADMYPDDSLSAEARVRLMNSDTTDVRISFSREARHIRERESIVELFDPNNLRLMEIGQVTEKLLNGTDGDNLQRAVTSYTEQNANWGADILRNLAQKDALKQDVWSAILWKLQWSLLNDDSKGWLLDYFGCQKNVSEQILLAFIYCAYHRFGDETSESIKDQLLLTSFKIWDSLDEVGGLRENLWDQDWMMLAINYPAGGICEYWIGYTHQLQEQKPESERTWPPGILERMSSTLAARSKGDQSALAVLGANLARCRYLAPKWSSDVLYPFLNEHENEAVSIIWISFMSYGRLSRELATELPKFLEKLFVKMSILKDSLLKHLSKHVAAIACSGLFQISDQWLNSFELGLSTNLRASWIHELSLVFRQLSLVEKERIWSSWIKKWWHRRNLGLPIPLSGEEMKQLSYLITHLGTDSAEALALLKDSTLTFAKIPHNYIFIDIQESWLIQNNPSVLLGVILWNLENSINVVGSDPFIRQLFLALPPIKKLKPDLITIYEYLLKLNVHCDYQQLKDLIEKRFVD